MQKIVENILSSTKSIFKILLLSRFRKFFKYQQKFKEVVILGNGPSLNALLEENTWFLDNKQTICVNYFGLSKYYEQVQPDIYVLIDPAFWRSEAPETLIEQRNQLYEKIVKETTWQLSVFMPYESKKNKNSYKKLLENKNVKICYFNNVGVEGFKSFLYFCFNNSLGLPRPGNVLVACIYISIKLEFEKMYLAGADHDWLKYIMVGDDNKIYMVHNHFYEDTKDQKIVPKRWSGEDIPLYKMLENFVVPLKSYFILEDFSKTKKSKIFNITPNSFIDAFERYDIKQEKHK